MNFLLKFAPMEHCPRAVGASLREAAKISVCRKTVGTNVFSEEISARSLSVSYRSFSLQSPRSFSAYASICFPKKHAPVITCVFSISPNCARESLENIIIAPIASPCHIIVEIASDKISSLLYFVIAIKSFSPFFATIVLRFSILSSKLG